ncbi:MAG: hypothetical protein Q4E24_15975, partial [bacterium]|nr:hypothetical protein [bacterium]
DEPDTPDTPNVPDTPDESEDSDSSSSSTSSSSRTRGGSVTTSAAQIPSVPYAGAAVTAGQWEQAQDGSWSFRLSSGVLASGWKYVADRSGNHWYHFSENGIMDTGWYRADNGDWYYLEESGAIQGAAKAGWYRDTQDGNMYYLDLTTYIMAVDWTNIDAKWYYFNEEVLSATGWVREDETGKWIYNGGDILPLGAMMTNAQTPDGYTVDADGIWIEDEKN